MSVDERFFAGRVGSTTPRDGRATMLWTILVILLVLWVLGLATSYTLGGFIHVLLVVAVIILVVRLLSGRRVI
jgi:hypothetical protein